MVLAVLAGAGAGPGAGQCADLGTPDGVTLAAGPPGSTLARQADMLAKAITEHLSLPVTLRITSGSGQTLSDVDQRLADLALIRLHAVSDRRRAASGSNAAPPLSAVTLLAPWQRFTYLVLVPRDAPAGISTLQNARRIGFGPPQSGSESLIRPLYESAGLKPQITTGTVTGLLEQLANGSLDAILLAQPRDGGWGIDPDAPKLIQPLAPQDDDGQSVLAAQPHVTLITAPAPPPFTNPVSRQLATWGVVVAHRDLAPEFVARLTDLVLRLPVPPGDAPRQAPELLGGRPLPLHPGAARVYRERNLRPLPESRLIDAN